MKFSGGFLTAIALLLGVSSAFTTKPYSCNHVALRMTTMAEAGVPPATSDATEVEEMDIPTNLPSESGMDYVPLATMLATGQLAEADQVC